ncbi:MAG: C40 family peptidase [bacterium]|nr:C40 family peptidase [bacterium]
MKKKTEELIYDYALSMVGLPYIYGGNDAIEGYDCSGLVIAILQAWGKVGLKFDATAHILYLMSSKHPVKKPTFGTLSFYGSSNERVTHIGFCLNSELMIEAGSGTSRTLSKKDAVRDDAFVRLSPIRRRKDLIGFTCGSSFEE